MEGVFKSWALPKEPVADTKIKRLAIQVEDHDLAYGDFEGEIAEGQYGAGKVEIWDSGEYKLLEAEEGVFRFELQGKRLSGTWKLVHTSYPPGNQWLFIASRGAKRLDAAGSQ